MSNLTKLTPQEKKTIFIALIDDMTAAAVDRSAQGYTQFLQCRNELIRTIDSFVEADQRREDMAESISAQLNDYFEIKNVTV